MKILLINPPFENSIQSCQPKILEEGLDFLPPLGLMYIAGYLERESNCRVEILDAAQVERLTYSRLKEKVRRKMPDAVGITAMTFTIIDVIKTARIIKEISPDIKVILGGPHTIIYPEETMGIADIDFLVLGEGEKVIKELLENCDSPGRLKEIKGIVFRENGKIVNTGIAPPVKDLDELPFPARHLTPYRKYFSVVSPRAPVTTMFTSRGCPYRCLFCDRPNFGKSFRARSAENVVNEMERCREMKIKEVFIYDDTFGVDRQRVMDVCSGIKKRKLDIAWDIRTRVDMVDEEVLRALKESNCRRIHYGVEAGTQKILNVLRKGITLEGAEKAFKGTKKFNIQTVGYFMIGSPCETKEDILKTIKFMKRLNPDYVHAAITTPFPATDLYKMALEEGIIGYDVWKKFAASPGPDFVPPLWEKELSREELFSLLKKAYSTFYIRPAYIFKKLLQLKSGKELLRKARAGLNLLKI
jgi:radical SAM superfamily enzyme YgiQ (UPF0313 family)